MARSGAGRDGANRGLLASALALGLLLTVPGSAWTQETGAVSTAVGVPRITESAAITFLRTMEEVFDSGDAEAIKAFYREHYLEDAKITLTVSVRIGGEEQDSQTWTTGPEEQTDSVERAVPKSFSLEIRDIRVALDRQSAVVRYDSVEIVELKVSDGEHVETVETRTEGACSATLEAGHEVMKIRELACDAVLMPNT